MSYGARNTMKNEVDVIELYGLQNIPNKELAILDEKFKKKKPVRVMKQRNLVGQKFGKLTVIKQCGKGRGNRYYSLVRCDCGYEYLVPDTYLISGRRKSCHNCNRPSQTHGKTHTRLFYIWSSMKQRCLNKNRKSYQEYGERGISVCAEWLDFQTFYEWAMNNGYQEDLTIDRIDSNGNYEPSNCRWADLTTQARNKRNTLFVDYEGTKKPVQEVAEIVGMKAATIAYRLRKGWSDYDATHIRVGSIEAYRRSF